MTYYEWQGIGLKIVFPCGGDVFIQGEEGSELHDQLEACENDEQVEAILSEYSVLLEGNQ